jgi:hypothetical protein
MRNRPPSPKAKTRSMSALGRITGILRQAALIVAVAATPLVAFPAPAAAASNTAGCTYISGTNGTELYFTVGHCDNAFEGTIYLVYPDGSTTTFVPYGEFWQWMTGDSYLRTTSVKITQTGTYTLKLDGVGADAALQRVEVHWSKSWSLTAPRGSTPAPQPDKPSKPDITQPSPSSAAIAWTGGEGTYRVVAWKLKKSGKKKPGTRTTCVATLEALGSTTCTLEGLIPGRWKIRIIRTVDGATAVRTAIYRVTAP